MDFQRSTYFPFGFALRKDVWTRYRVDELAEDDAPRDKPIETRAVRVFAQRVNEDHGAHAESAAPIGAGQLLTLGVLTEILRYLLDYYCTQQAPGAMRSAFDWTKAREGGPVVDEPPPAFVDEFPPQKVQLGKVPPPEFLASAEATLSAREITAREMVLLGLSMANPAMRPFVPLFADDTLRARAPYVPLGVNIEQFFDTQPELDLLGEPLFECLRAPMRADPDSLEGQLDFIRKKWAHILPAGLKEDLFKVQDILGEEYKQRGGFVPGGMVEVMRFGPQQGAAADVYPEFERFSPDADWMSNVVLMAKSVYVWLDQLSKQHQRHIHRLDQIPDEELDRLARWGFNGLWLIGLWERSEASATIKKMMGNPDAVSSAYSLFDYVIANDLGGDEAYANLRERARMRGIRLASDMVPNHMGIFSRWVVEHPHWFIQLHYPPYPNYSFTGANLSHAPGVGLYIEDGYWTQRDAAVVFKRVDHHTGETRYIYHGNDGTSMPWNDTAQLNYLMPEVREAVIQTILHVARKFPIIRFDAAMTLAKKHFQRLWFPKLGDAGAIPSRAEHGMGRADFDRAMPEEFWREVVDRVAREVPDTLLLAEAFWLMEGYFVRTLGMHRVYNSAFMNMLKMEQNANYRATVRNVLEFSPEILKRFVNFMNNPDERTAVEQFGKGDKYIGCCLLMITMPGLPMFGHGQIEGFTEKYGMEYRRAYWDEHVDDDLVRRHEHELFPLMRRRYMFSGVEHFAFYDFHTPQGHVDENVFAYSNRTGGERALVYYNNAYNSTSGWVKQSTGLNQGRGDDGHIITKSLADSLGLRREDHVFYSFRDHRDGLEYIRHSRQLCDEGMFVHLHGYQWHVFIDWREIVDTDGSWGELAWHLEGRGVESLDYERRARQLAPLHHAFRGYFSADRLTRLLHLPDTDATESQIVDALRGSFGSFLDEVRPHANIHDDAAGLLKPSAHSILYVHRQLASLPKHGPDEAAVHASAAQARWTVPLAYALLKPVSVAIARTGDLHDAAAWMDTWLLAREVRSALADVLGDSWKGEQAARAVRVALRVAEHGLLRVGAPPAFLSQFLHVLDDSDAQTLLQFNEHEGVQYFNREQFEALVKFLGDVRAPAFENIHAVGALDAELDDEREEIEALLAAADAGGYRVERLREFLDTRTGDTET